MTRYGYRYGDRESSFTDKDHWKYEDDVENDDDDDNDDDDENDNNDKVVSLPTCSSIRLPTKCHITSHRTV